MYFLYEYRLVYILFNSYNLENNFTLILYSLTETSILQTNKKEEKENLKVNREQEAKRKNFWDFLQGRPSGCENGSD